MKKTVLAGLLACILPLAACSSLGAGAGAGTASAVLGNLEHCDRDYMGDLGVTGGSMKVKIACKAKPFTAAEIEATNKP